MLPEELSPSEFLLILNHGHLQQMKKTTTTGRKKIEIKELDQDSSKHVTFSKRHAGLFKKASELSVLCNAEIAMIVFSPTEKPYCSGHPDTKTDPVIKTLL